MIIEEAVIKNFFIKERRKRFLELIKDRKPGEGFGYLAHIVKDLDERFCFEAPSGNTEKII